MGSHASAASAASDSEVHDVLTSADDKHLYIASSPGICTEPQSWMNLHDTYVYCVYIYIIYIQTHTHDIIYIYIYI